MQKQLAALQDELAATRQTVALSMLQQQSASQRLEGVSWSTRLPEPDPKVMAALFHTLRFDNSVDVRLAALDALSRYAGRPEIRSELLDVLQNQQSPLVQIALIDLLVDLRSYVLLDQGRARGEIRMSGEELGVEIPVALLLLGHVRRAHVQAVTIEQRHEIIVPKHATKECGRCFELRLLGCRQIAGKYWRASSSSRPRHLPVAPTSRISKRSWR